MYAAALVHSSEILFAIFEVLSWTHAYLEFVTCEYKCVCVFVWNAFEPGICFMLFGFSCNIWCFGSCNTNANSTNFLKTEPMRLPMRGCTVQCVMHTCIARAFCRNRGNFRKCIIVSFRCYLECNLKCIQAPSPLPGSSHSIAVLFCRYYDVCGISYVLMFRLDISVGVEHCIIFNILVCVCNRTCMHHHAHPCAM